MTSAQGFAEAWHRLIFAQGMSEAWRLMTEDFRRVVAQTAMNSARERGEHVDATVEALSKASPKAEYVHDFYDAASKILQNACTVEPSMVKAGKTVRVEAPAYEVVRLYVLEDLAVDERGERYLPPETSARALTLIVTAEEYGSWRMAGIGAVLSPGWPPTVLWQPEHQV